MRKNYKQILLFLLSLLVLVSCICGCRQDTSSNPTDESEKEESEISLENLGVLSHKDEEVSARIQFQNVDGEQTWLMLLQYFKDITNDSEARPYMSHGTWSFTQQDDTTKSYVLTVDDDTETYPAILDTEENTVTIDGIVFKQEDISPQAFFEAPLFETGSIEVTESNALQTEHMGSPLYYAALEVKNTGNVPVRLSGLSCDIEDEDGTYLDHIEEFSFSPFCPEVIQPGECAYAGGIKFINFGETDTDTTLDLSSQIKPTFHVQHTVTNEASIPLLVEQADLKPYSGGFWTMSGKISNSGENSVYDAIGAEVLYDSEGRFIGVVVSPIIDMLNAGDSIGISDTLPESVLPNVIPREQIAEIKTFAFGKTH